MPLEVRRLGRTIRRWRDRIGAWHRFYVSNGPTEAISNLVKRVKRVAFGMRRFGNYRIRALLYAGRPNWTLLNNLTPPMRSEEPDIDDGESPTHRTPNPALAGDATTRYPPGGSPKDGSVSGRCG
jgi:hypothetical protein